MQRSAHDTESLVFFILLQLTLIVLSSRLAGNVARRIRQSRAVGEIVVGILLGPSLFGLLAPGIFGYVFHSVSGEPLTILSQVGLILLMFQIGLEFDFSHVAAAQNRRAVYLIAAAGIAAPFLVGIGFGVLSAEALARSGTWPAYCLFVGTAFSITALPILGRIMIELRMHRTVLGFIAISAAAINDVVGWLLLAIVSALAAARFSGTQFALRVVLLAGFVALSFGVVRPLLHRFVARAQARGDPLSPGLLSVVLAAVFLAGMSTHLLGIFAIFGGFLLGVLLHDRESLVSAWRERVGGFVEVFFLPIFFTYTGLRTDIRSLDSATLWAWCGLLFAMAAAGKLGACYIAARWAGLDVRQSGAIGIMMNTRALMELVVVNVGYDLGVIPPAVFTMLVLMAIGSTLITTPALRGWLAHDPAFVAAQSGG
ncbi:MAG TPA: cation:proton antiporter [Burkholderiaceae bacterium]|nr:cation:proton antiporter [Burkholderiaceae bacterium]